MHLLSAPNAPPVCFLLTLAFALLATQDAHAQTIAHADLLGTSVHVDRAPDHSLSLVVGGSPPIALAPGGNATLQQLSIPPATVLVVRTDGDPASAAIVIGAPHAAPSVLFHDSLAFRGEDPGERARYDVVVADLGAGHPEVIVGERREDVQICGLGAALVNARAIDPATLTLRRVVLNPLRAGLIENVPPAQPLNAIALGDPAHAPLPMISSIAFTSTVDRGTASSAVAALADRSDTTAWTAQQHSVANARVTLAGFAAERVIVVAPPLPAVLPHRVTVLTGDAHAALDVTLPVVPPGTRVAIPLLPARELHCLSFVVADTANATTTAIADVQIASELEHAPDLAATLAAALGGPHGDQAAQLLEGLGDRGVAAIAQQLGTLEPPAAREAIRLLEGHRTPAVAAALVAVLERREIAGRARDALQRFGPAALEALSAAIPMRASVTALIATLRAPLEARLHAIVPALSLEPAPWHAARGATEALIEEAVGAGSLEAWLAMIPSEITAATRALRLAAEAATTDAARATVAARAHAVQPTRFDDRFRLLLPLAGDATGVQQVETTALHDADADLRWEAVRVLGSGRSPDALARALTDPTPRVRAQAASGLRGASSGHAALLDRLAHDAWPSVRASAAEALGGVAENAGALSDALRDPSVIVVRAAIAALGQTPGATIGARLMTYAEDGGANPDLRTDALHAIATRCDRAMTARLATLVGREIDPILPPTEQAVGHAALAALGHIDPPQARALLARLGPNAFAIAALGHASQNACPAR